MVSTVIRKGSQGHLCCSRKGCITERWIEESTERVHKDKVNDGVKKMRKGSTQVAQGVSGEAFGNIRTHLQSKKKTDQRRRLCWKKAIGQLNGQKEWHQTASGV